MMKNDENNADGGERERERAVREARETRVGRANKLTVERQRPCFARFFLPMFHQQSN